MKKYGLAVGIGFLCAACCFFFLIGFTIDGLWWLFGIPLVVAGVIFIFISDTLNKGKEKRAKEKEARGEAVKNMKDELKERLAKEKEARDKTLKNIKK